MTDGALRGGGEDCPEVISFAETYELAGARIGDAEMSRKVNQHFQVEGATFGRDSLRETMLKVFYRSPFGVQDLKPEQEGVGSTRVSRITDA
jgi:hypothetical protein